MKTIHTFLVSALCVLLSTSVFAQSIPDVTLVTTGEGNTKTEAEAMALRRAVEQAYGTFVSANTVIMDDSIVHDEIATISSGNIERYSVCAASNVGDMWYVTVSAVVSINNLVSYVKGHGGTTEFAGQTFAMEMKLRKLNKENEEKVMKNLCETIRRITTDVSLFDYSISQGQATFAGEEKYSFPLTITATPNQNYRILIDQIQGNLKAVSLSAQERSAYEATKYPYYRFQPLKLIGDYPSLFFRSQKSPAAVQYVFEQSLIWNLNSYKIERKTIQSTVDCTVDYRFEFRLQQCHDIVLSAEQVYETTGFSVFQDLSHMSPSDYVDLGLSVKWAKYNVGAANECDYGGFYQWGGTIDMANRSCDWDAYPYGNDWNQLTKYKASDNKTVLNLEDDAAHVILGGDWRMPTKAEWIELSKNCSWHMTEINGVRGCRVQSKKSGYTDKWIFLPAAGIRNGDGFLNDGFCGYYWSSSLRADTPYTAYCMYFCQNIYDYYVPDEYRSNGLQIRPVFVPQQKPHASQTSSITAPRSNTQLIPQSDSKPTVQMLYCNAYDGYVNIRAEASSKSAVVGRLENGPQGAELLEKTTQNWWKIRFNGVVGYVYKTLLQSIPTESLAPGVTGDLVVGKWRSGTRMLVIASNGKYTLADGTTAEEGKWRLSKSSIILTKGSEEQAYTIYPDKNMIDSFVKQ